MGESAESTSKMGLDDWIKHQLSRGNIIRNIGNIIIFPALMFWLVGQFYNDLVIVMQGFLLIYFLLMPLMMTNDAIVDSQNAYLDGKWEIKDAEKANEAEQRLTLWRRMAPKLLILAAIPAGISYLLLWIYIWITGNNIIPLDPWTLLFIAAFIVLIPTWLISHIWIKRYLAADLSAFVATMKKPMQPEPFRRYFIWEHVLPWTIILVLLNLIINLKGFAENARVDGVIIPWDLAFSMWATIFVLFCWMGLSGMNQVRADVHLGRVSEGRPLKIWLGAVIIFGIPFLAGTLAYVIAILLGITQLSVAFSTSLIVVIAMIAGVVGRYLGIWFGITEEFKKLRSEKIK
jgi:hypothetical protein